MLVFRSCFCNAAWRDEHIVPDCGASLRDAHDYTSTEWWLTQPFLLSQSKSRRLGMQHKHHGAQRTLWEQPFVVCWDMNWRTDRDSFKSLGAWMAEFPDFADKVLKEWKLSLHNFKMTEEPGAVPVTVKLPSNGGCASTDRES